MTCKQNHFKLFSVLFYILFLTFFTQTIQAKQHSTINIGTWENKDEDGDGVLDEYDDYPFEPKKSSYPLIKEKEFNNNLGVATPVNTKLPFRVGGVLKEKLDTDLYRFEAKEDDSITVTLKSSSKEFEPHITIFNVKGRSLQPFSPNYHPIGIIKAATSFGIPETGTYYLAINDEDRSSSPDYKYQAFIFHDADFDAIDDDIEPAFAFNKSSYLHSDNDGIGDGDEYHVLDENGKYNHDADNDGIPNWLDEDSDGDKIRDSAEKVYDFDDDGRPSFVDDDSDGNNISDTIETNGGTDYFRDHDNEGVFDYVDTDDDGDLLLDIHDDFPKQELKTAMPGELGHRTLYYLSYLYKENPFNDVHVKEAEHTLIGNGIEGTGFIVLDMGYKKPPLNFPITIQPDTTFKFTLPKYVKKVFFTANGYRSNRLPVTYRNRWVPLINPLLEKYYRSGDTVILTGRKFFTDTKVFIGNKVVKPSLESEKKLTFILPENVRSGTSIKLRTSYGYSNLQAIKTR